MSLDTLPDELKLKIVYYLHGKKKALHSLSSTCKAISKIAQCALHQGCASFESSNTGNIPNLFLFVRTLIDRPDLAIEVKCLALKAIGDIAIQEQGLNQDSFVTKVIDYLTSRDASLMSDDAKGIVTNWVHYVNTGDSGSAFGLLLMLVPNLKHLNFQLLVPDWRNSRGDEDLTLDFVSSLGLVHDESPLETMFPTFRASRNVSLRLASLVKLDKLETLTTVNANANLRSWFPMPAVRIMEIDLRKCAHPLYYPLDDLHWCHDPFANLHTLKVNIPYYRDWITSEINVLRMCHAERVFSIENLVLTIGSTSSDSEYQGPLADNDSVYEIAFSIEDLHTCLESFELVLGEAFEKSSHTMPHPDEPACLAKFSKLRTLKVPQPLLIADLIPEEDEDEFQWSRLLPPNMEELTITGVNDTDHMTVPWLEVFVKQLHELPNLKMINLCCDDVPVPAPVESSHDGSEPDVSQDLGNFSGHGHGSDAEERAHESNSGPGEESDYRLDNEPSQESSQEPKSAPVKKSAHESNNGSGNETNNVGTGAQVAALQFDMALDESVGLRAKFEAAGVTLRVLPRYGPGIGGGARPVSGA